MDLRSMLNDSQGQKVAVAPRVTSHTPHSSYDGRIEHTPGSDVSSARPTPYGPPLNTGDPRAQGGASYFAMQSPHPNNSASASTPSVGPHSAYAQSPGSHAGVYTPRMSIPPSNAPAHHATFVSPSPSSLHHPPTPGSAHSQSYHPQSVYVHHNSYPGATQQFQSPPPPQANGLPHARQISPTTQYQSQPATPLGPPIHYPKASPQAIRPPSQGYQEHRPHRGSVSSISSILSKDYNHYPPPVPVEQTRRESIPGPYPYAVRERSRSESVSPKTIPRPPPQREHVIGGQSFSHGRPSLPLESSTRSTMSHQDSFSQHDGPSDPPPIPYSSISSMHEQQPPAGQITSQSPAPLPANAPTRPSPIAKGSVKRSASHLSDAKSPPHKRPRGEIPRWAQSARGNRPLRFIDAPQRNPQSRQHQMPPRPNGNAGPGGPQHVQPQPGRPHGNAGNVASGGPQHAQPQPGVQEWESSIGNILPFEDLTRSICDWIMKTIGERPAPYGSTWEIEAKVGTIRDKETGERFIIPPVATETLLTDGTRGIRFESSMNIVSSRPR